MYARTKTIGRQALYIAPSGEKAVKFDINPAYVITPERKVKLSPVQKKRKARKESRKARVYNLMHAS